MGKRMMALLLAAVMIWNMGAETLYAMEHTTSSVPEAQTEIPDTQENNSETPNPGEEGGQPTENPGETTVPPSGEETTPPESGEETTPPAQKPEPTVEETRAIYTVTFDFNGGQTGDGALQITQSVQEGNAPDMAQVAEPVKTGYVFQGWRTETGEVFDVTQPVQSNLTVKAAWAPITWNIQFDANGGTGTMNPQTFAYDELQPLAVCQFTRTGYAFIGWEWAGMGILYQEGTYLPNLTVNNGEVIVFRAKWEEATYTVRFDANGGEGTMDEQDYTYSQKKALYANEFKKTGYSFAGWNTRKDGTGESYKNKAKVSKLAEKKGDIVVLYAMWKGISYKVQYDGNGATQGAMESSSHIYGTESCLLANGFQRKGYKFNGWNTKKDGSGTSYKDGAAVKNLTAKKNGTVTLYAKWKVITWKITYKPGKGKMGKSVRKTYTVNTKTFTLSRPSRKGYDFDGWYKDSALKKRIGTVKQGRTGNLTLYAKWVKCTRKAKADAAKMTRCKAVKTGKVNVKATVKKRIASSDDYYYLVYVNPINGKPIRMAAKAYKKKYISFNLKTSENQGYVTSKLGLAVKKDGKYQMISGSSYVKNPEKAASNKSAYKPGKTKKGIQFHQDVSEIHKTNSKQYFLNFTAALLLCENNPSVPYTYNGKTYYFNSLDYYKSVVRECNANNVSVTVQMLLNWPEGHEDLINEGARVPGKLFYSWNIYSTGAREKMEAMFCYLGMVFGQKDCYVSNWILGNEVNHPAGWNYAGSMSKDIYFQTYAYTFRSLYYAIRSQYANAHIFICTDNYWSPSSSRRFSARQTITYFVEHLNAIQKGLKWNLAYHAYSFPLTYTRVWKGYGITDDINTPSVTMKNLQVLTNYIKKNYGSSVRIILSEQGYVSNESETLQAAALAYSYYIAACNPMIDAFIIRSYADDPAEVASGYHMGIEGKEAFEMFKYVDTSKSTRYTNRYLSVIGSSSWKKLVPGYKEKRLRTMYRKI